MKVFKIILSTLVVISLVVLIWAEVQISQDKSGVHFDGQAGIGIMFMFGLQLTALGCGILTLLTSLIVSFVKKEFGMLSKINVALSAACIVLFIFFSITSTTMVSISIMKKEKLLLTPLAPACSWCFTFSKSSQRCTQTGLRLSAAVLSPTMGKSVHPN